MNKFLCTSIRDINQKISSGNVRPSDISKAAVNLTAIVKPLNPYITVTSDLAKKQSENADIRQKECTSLGKFDGIPIAVKDNYCTDGVRTTCASLMLTNFTPVYDATVYSRLKNAGAVLIGKTNLDEFGMGSGTIDSYYGPTRNLWGSDVLSKYYSCMSDGEERSIVEPVDNTDWHIAGGSSGGSAVAVASGTCFAALGSDTGGSTRNPASYCGLVGLKPTYGLVSRYGLVPLLNSMDVPGILTRNVDDAVLMLNTIAGPDDLDSTTVKRDYVPVEVPNDVNIRNLRIGVPNEYYVEDTNEEVKNCWEEVARSLEEGGATIVSVSLPHTNYSIMCYSVLNRCDVASNLSCYDGLEYGYRAEDDISPRTLYTKTRSRAFNNVVKGRILVGNYFLLAENYEQYYVKAMKMRRLITQDFESVWQENVDLLLTPTTLTDAPKYNEFVKLDNQTQCLIQDYCTQPANMAGIPAINIPIKLSKRNLPLSLQLMAPLFQEERLLRTAKWIENAVKFPKLELKDETLLK